MYFINFFKLFFIHISLFSFFSTVWHRHSIIWVMTWFLKLIVSLDDSSWSGCYELLNTISYLPSPSSSRSSSQSSVSGVYPLVGCERRDLQHVRSAFPPASQPPSVCSRHWCSPCDTYDRFSSPAGPRGQRLKFHNSQLSSREVQQLLVWAKKLSSSHLTQINSVLLQRNFLLLCKAKKHQLKCLKTKHKCIIFSFIYLHLHFCSNQHVQSVTKLNKILAS